MAGDLYASIKPRPIEDIHIAGHPYRIDAHPAVVWLDALAGPSSTSDIIPGLLTPVGEAPDPAILLEEALLSGTFTHTEYEQTVNDVTDIAAARPWWTTHRIIAVAADEMWGDYVRGQIVLHHLDAQAVSLPAWLDAVYAIITTGLTPEKRQQFDARLAAPPPGMKMSPADRRRNRAAFDAVRDS